MSWSDTLRERAVIADWESKHYDAPDENYDEDYDEDEEDEEENKEEK